MEKIYRRGGGGFRVSVDLSRMFPAGDVRRRVWVWAGRGRVAGLRARLREVVPALTNRPLALALAGALLPPAETQRLLRPGDTLTAVPLAAGEWGDEDAALSPAPVGGEDAALSPAPVGGEDAPVRSAPVSVEDTPVRPIPVSVEDALVRLVPASVGDLPVPVRLDSGSGEDAPARLVAARAVRLLPVGVERTPRAARRPRSPRHEPSLSAAPPAGHSRDVPDAPAPPVSPAPPAGHSRDVPDAPAPPVSAAPAPTEPDPLDVSKQQALALLDQLQSVDECGVPPDECGVPPDEYGAPPDECGAPPVKRRRRRVRRRRPPRDSPPWDTPPPLRDTPPPPRDSPPPPADHSLDSDIRSACGRAQTPDEPPPAPRSPARSPAVLRSPLQPRAPRSVPALRVC